MGEETSTAQLSAQKATSVVQQWYKCFRCGLNLSSAINLREHHQTIHKGNKKFKCLLCSYVTIRNSDLKKHFLVHTGEKPFKCNLCDQSCKTKSDLNVHQLVHTKEKPHKCNKCECAFTQLGYLRKHQETFHGGYNPTRLKCSICGYVTSKQIHLDKHALVHKQCKKIFKCNECDYVSNYKGNVKNHQHVHRKENPYKCDKYESSFAKASHLKNHTLAVNVEGRPSDKDELFNLVDCELLPNKGEKETSFVDMRDLKATKTSSFKNHSLAVNKEVSPAMEEEKFEIVECEDLRNQVGEATRSVYLSPLNSNTKSSLKSHSVAVEEGVYLTIGEGTLEFVECEFLPKPKGKETSPVQLSAQKAKKVHKCLQCEINFSTASGLSKHKQVVHMGIKKFKCPLCSHVAVTNSKLEKHFLVHTGEKPYKCNVCDFVCKTKDALKAHQLVHTKEKRHKCTKCECTFTRIRSLKEHQDKLHGGYPTRFKCSICGYVATKQFHLDRHSLVHTQ